MAERKEPKKAPIILCYICGKEIYGEHVYIKTRRRTNLHIHHERMFQGGGK